VPELVPLDEPADANSGEPRPPTASNRLPVVEARDPTMPQFRPNSLADVASAPDPLSAEPDAAPRPESPPVPTSPDTDREGEAKADSSRSGDGTNGSTAAATTIPRATLVGWKRIDVAEQEARERGGWGKLSFEEFEAIYREEAERSNRLDYLGSWIDFCIP